jgi:hypothetical protein
MLVSSEIKRLKNMIVRASVDQNKAAHLHTTKYIFDFWTLWLEGIGAGAGLELLSNQTPAANAKTAAGGPRAASLYSRPA